VVGVEEEVVEEIEVRPEIGKILGYLDVAKEESREHGTGGTERLI